MKSAAKDLISTSLKRVRPTIERPRPSIRRTPTTRPPHPGHLFVGTENLARILRHPYREPVAVVDAPQPKQISRRSKPKPR